MGTMQWWDTDVRFFPHIFKEMFKSTTLMGSQMLLHTHTPRTQASACQVFPLHLARMTLELTSIVKARLSLSSLPAVNEARRVVQLPVRLVPPEILPGVLQGRQTQHDTDGNQSYLWLEGIYNGDEVEYSQAYEVDVGQAVELLEKVHGDEEERGVLGGLDAVAWEVAIGLLPLLQALIRQIGRQAAELLLPSPPAPQSLP